MESIMKLWKPWQNLADWIKPAGFT